MICFLPFVVLQPLDLIAITAIGRSLAVIAPLHTRKRTLHRSPASNREILRVAQSP